MDPRTEGLRQAQRLSRLVGRAVEDSGSSAAEVSRRLGRSSGYLGRVLSGRLPLRIGEVFALLEVLDQHPGAFFERHFPLGGREVQALTEKAGGAGESGAASLGDLLELAACARPVPPAGQLLERTAGLLRARMAGARRSLRAASAGLGLARQGLARALRRPERLAAWHVFGALAAIGMTPARFFAEVFAPAEANLPPLLSQSELLDALEHLLSRLAGAACA